MVATILSVCKGTSAYIDPASTSILLTSITAIAVAIGATFIILWRKFKKGVSKALHIDPNAGKEVEDDLVVNDSAEDNAAVAAQAENGEVVSETTEATETTEPVEATEHIETTEAVETAEQAQEKE